MKTYGIVLAGGKGSRMNIDIPKQYMLIKEKPLLYYSLKAFDDSCVDEIILVLGDAIIENKTEKEFCLEKIIKKYNIKKNIVITNGGAQRYDSVNNALKTINDENAYILIHDGARPCVTPEIINDCAENVKKNNACVVAVPVKDTIKVVDEHGLVKETPDRKTLWQIQTPQCFEYKLLKECYKTMYSDANKGNITDDAMIVEKYSNKSIKIISGSYKNIKVTTIEDSIIASCFINQ